MPQFSDATWRRERTIDPRVDDLFEDSPRWTWLFEQAYDAGNLDLLGGLNYIRCCGARIMRTASGASWRIGRGDCPSDEYERVKTAVLAANKDALRNLLAAVPGSYESGIQTGLEI
jgi:hypothetical protein